jgi:hypothetical protein
MFIDRCSFLVAEMSHLRHWSCTKPRYRLGFKLCRFGRCAPQSTNHPQYVVAGVCLESPATFQLRSAKPRNHHFHDLRRIIVQRHFYVLRTFEDSILSLVSGDCFAQISAAIRFLSAHCDYLSPKAIKEPITSRHEECLKPLVELEDDSSATFLVLEVQGSKQQQA